MTQKQQAMFSAASGRGLIEAGSGDHAAALRPRFPRHRAAASLKQRKPGVRRELALRFPRHRAAASLKHRRHVFDGGRVDPFSAASGRGLIEADPVPFR